MMLLSESLTKYDTDKKVVVHCQLVLIVILFCSHEKVGSIVRHGGVMK